MAQPPGSPAASSSVQLVTGTGTVFGTLTVPGGAAKVPVALIIAGSGPTDRDGNSPMLPGKNNMYKQLADALAAAGVASLRYDKRGIAESRAAGASETDLRFDMYVDDAVGWIEQLRQDSRFSRVLVIGHSEGSLIGMLAAKRCNAAGFISIAGAGHTAADILRTQLAGKLPPELAAKSDAILKNLEAGKTTENPPPELAALYRSSVQPYLISWFRYDPARSIAELKIPVLVVQGTTDIQVNSADADRLASGHAHATLETIDGMNHVLKEVRESSQQVASYSDPNLPLHARLAESIATFVGQ